MVKESHMHFVLKGNNSPQEDTNEMRGGRGDTRLEDFWDGKQLQWTVTTSWVERRLVKGWCAWFSDYTGFVIYYFRHWQADSKITPFDSYLLVFIPWKKPLLFSLPEFINSLLLNRLTSFSAAQGCRFQDRVAKSLASILGTQSSWIFRIQGRSLRIELKSSLPDHSPSLMGVAALSPYLA